MKILIEAIEQKQGSEQTKTQTADIIRTEIKTDEKAAIVETSSKMQEGKTYIVRRHKCRHDEHPIKPCIVEDISIKEISAAADSLMVK